MEIPNPKPTFISTHLHQSHIKILLLFSQTHKESYALHNDDDPDFTQHASFDYPFHIPYTVVGTCNGLLCLSDDLAQLFLWNPCVRKFLQLPSSNLTCDTHSVFGFGFDPKSNAYKVVRFVSLLEVYSLSTDKWRMVLKEYGVASSWTEFPDQCPSLGMLQPCLVGFRSNGEVVLENAIRGLVSWNPDSQKIKNLKISGFNNTFFGSYVESLVLLDKAANGVVTYRGKMENLTSCNHGW